MIKILLPLILFMANLQATQTQVVILLGPPGAGKGSAATLLKDKMELAHISTGDLLRQNIKNGTQLGEKAKSYMDAGDLVPDELIFSMLFERVDAPDCEKGYLLDGFPRTIEQAETLQKRLAGRAQVKAVSLEVPDSALVERITKRQVCRDCQTPYHLTFSPPKTKGKCDRCPGELYQRSDDTETVVKSRLKIYHEKTAPLIDYYREQKALQTVDASLPPNEVLSQITALLTPVVKDKVGAGDVH